MKRRKSLGHSYNSYNSNILASAAETSSLADSSPQQQTRTCATANVRSTPVRAQPQPTLEFGSFHENVGALLVARAQAEFGDLTSACAILVGLRDHIVLTGEPKSVRVLLRATEEEIRLWADLSPTAGAAIRPGGGDGKP